VAWWSKISPKAIGEELQRGTRRNAFQCQAPVEFREEAVREARRLGLLGCLLSSEDGSARGFVEGPAAAIDEFFDWCINTARVVPAAIDVTDEDHRPLGEFTAFDQ
jgi:acylphosphatase